MQRRFEIQPDRGAGAGVELTRHVVVEVAIVGASGTAEDDVLLVAEQDVGAAEPRLDRTGIRITVATGADVVVDVVAGVLDVGPALQGGDRIGIAAIVLVARVFLVVPANETGRASGRGSVCK